MTSDDPLPSGTPDNEEQRPKNPAIDPAERDPCPGCSSYLIEPFIKCVDCKPGHYLVCLLCFARGFESGKHENSHRYEIITNDFPLLEYNWSSAEEMRLLDALADCGAGNWAAIAKQVRTKSKQECELHYMKCYVLHARYPLPEMPHRPVTKIFPPIPFKACEDPCRPLPESHRAQDMAGYLAARGDFSEEYLNSAEWDIKDVHFAADDWPVLKALKLTMVRIYQAKLRERGRRKSILRQHGLINASNHTLRYLRKLPHEQQQLQEALRPVMRLQHPIAHDKMLAGFAVERSLRKRVKKLQKYRRAGITSHRICKLYDKMSANRNTEERGACLTEVISYKDDKGALMQWLQRQSLGSAHASSLGPIIPTVRKTVTPLDISDLPGVDRLTDKEKDFCASIRLVPEAYLLYKSMFVSECEKHGFLRLAQARTLAKIDVNKTRKLYDFMTKQGYLISELSKDNTD